MSGATSGRYSTRVANSLAGGDPGFFYVGGPLNVRLVDRRGGTRRYELCVTPPPIDRAACRRPRANTTVDGLAPSQAGRTKLRFAPAGGPVIVRFIRVRPAPGATHATGRQRVCDETLKVFTQPARLYRGALFKGESMRVRRFSASGTYAYGFAYGKANKWGWVTAAGLCPPRGV